MEGRLGAAEDELSGRRMGDEVAEMVLGAT